MLRAAATTAATATDFGALNTAYQNALQAYNTSSSDTGTQANLVSAYTALVTGFTIGAVNSAVTISGINSDDATAIAIDDSADTGLAIGAEVFALNAAAATADSTATAAEAADAAAALTDAVALHATATQADTAATAAEGADSTAADALKGSDEFNALVTAYHEADDANPLLDKLTTAENAISNEAKTGSQDKIDALDKAVTDLNVAQTNVGTLASLNKDIESAVKVFTDHDLQAPVSLAAGANSATAESDIFLVGEADSTIANFGLLGTDSLYIGKGFTLNTGDIATAGNDSVLEAFLSTNGSGDTVVTLETQPWSSSATDAVVAITLTGVAAANVTLADGFVTAA
ncbi:hypothetical protein [Pseudomonas sp.]|uniref:hypothetical protein n=1 Tax=Pseudomonas sp. TaxID=306 RepID=UPI00258E023E|nr:hypothetical protein [Pseudomonas sp.]